MLIHNLSDSNHDLQGFLLEEHPQYKTKYKGPRRFFITANYKTTTLQDLISKERNRLAQEIPDRSNVFLPCILLRVNHRTQPLQKGWQYTSFKSMNNQRDKKELKTFRRLFVFGSLLDNDQRVFVVVEYSTIEESIFWVHNQGKNNVSVGDRFCILEPKFEGEFKESKTPIIKTPHAFCEMKAPSIPIRRDMNFTDGGERYFILKEVSIKIRNLNMMDTKCAGTLCDRTRLDEQGLCGCYTMHARTTGSSTSMVFKFDLSVSFDGDSHFFENVSSLRTTKLFYEGGIIPSNTIAQYMHPWVMGMVRKQVTKTVEHINQGHKWTCIGWGKRGWTTNPNDTNGETTSSVEIKKHITYLYPTRQEDIDDLPPNKIIRHEILQSIMNRISGGNDTGHSEDVT